MLSASWKYNSADAYYRCRVLGCSLAPNFPVADTSTLRLMFDARGERDLRHPSTSHLALELVVTPAPEPNLSGPAAPLTAAPALTFPALVPPTLVSSAVHSGSVPSAAQDAAAGAPNPPAVSTALAPPLPPTVWALPHQQAPPPAAPELAEALVPPAAAVPPLPGPQASPATGPAALAAEPEPAPAPVPAVAALAAWLGGLAGVIVPPPPLPPPPPPAVPVREEEMVVQCAHARPTHELLGDQCQGHYCGILEWDHPTTRLLLTGHQPTPGAPSAHAGMAPLVARARSELEALAAAQRGPGSAQALRQQRLVCGALAALALGAPCFCGRAAAAGGRGGAGGGATSAGATEAPCGAAPAAAGTGPSSGGVSAAAGMAGGRSGGGDGLEGTTGADEGGASGVRLSWRLCFFYASHTHRELADYKDVVLLEVPWCPRCTGDLDGEWDEPGGAAAREGGGAVARTWRQRARHVPAGQWEQDVAVPMTEGRQQADRQVWAAWLLPRSLVARRVAGVPSAESWWCPPTPPVQPPQWRKVQQDVPEWVLGQEWILGWQAPAGGAEEQDGAPEQQADWLLAGQVAEDNDTD